MKVPREIICPLLLLLISIPLHYRAEGSEGGTPLLLGAAYTGDFVSNLTTGLQDLNAELVLSGNSSLATDIFDCRPTEFDYNPDCTNEIIRIDK